MVLSNYVFFVHVYENFMDVSKTESFYAKQTCDFEKLVMKSLFLGVTSLSRKRYIIFLVLLTLFFDYNFVAIPLIELQVCRIYFMRICPGKCNFQELAMSLGL